MADAARNGAGNRLLVDGQMYDSLHEAGAEIVAGTLLDHSVEVSFEGSDQVYEVACNACKLHIDNEYGSNPIHIRRIVDACFLGVQKWRGVIDEAALYPNRPPNPSGERPA